MREWPRRPAPGCDVTRACGVAADSDVGAAEACARPPGLEVRPARHVGGPRGGRHNNGATAAAPQQQRHGNGATTKAHQQRRHNGSGERSTAAPSPQVRDLRRDGRRRPEPAISAANSPSAEPSDAAQAPSASAPAPAASSTCHGVGSSTCHGRLLGLKWRRGNVQASATTTMTRRIAAAVAGATAKDGRQRE